MKKISHQIIGLTTAYVLGLPLFPALVSSVLPDIDTKWMHGNKLLTAHRGITHHVLLGTAIILIALFLQNKIITSFAVGYTSHLFADALTISGIPYWTNKDRISLRLFKTGSAGEAFFLFSFLFVFFLSITLSHSFYVPVDVQLIQKLIWDFYHNINVIVSLF